MSSEFSKSACMHGDHHADYSIAAIHSRYHSTQSCHAAACAALVPASLLCLLLLPDCCCIHGCQLCINSRPHRQTQALNDAQAGGAINVGYTSFTASSSCSATDAPPQPTVRVTQSLFTGNLATDRGGAIGLQAGRLFLSVSFHTPCNPATS